MKTFKDIINEVAEPKGGDEKRFKAKHVVAKYDHPAAEDEQFTAKKIKKDKSKPAGYHDGKDEEVYEETEEDRIRKHADRINREKSQGLSKTQHKKAMAAADRIHRQRSMAAMKKEEADVHTKRADKKAVIVHDVDSEGKSKTTVHKQRAGEIKVEGYVSAAQRKAVWASRNDEKEGKKKKKSFKEMFSGQDLAEDPWEEVPMMARQMEFICEAAEDIKEYVMSGIDPEEWFQNKVAHIHGQMQGLYAYVEGDERMKSAKMADMNPMGEEVDLEEKVYASDYNVGHEKSQFGGYTPHVTHKKTGKTMYLGQTSYKKPEHAKGHADAYLKGYEAMGDRHANRKASEYEKSNKQHLYQKEEVELDEAFKMGSMKLKDGSTVKLSKEEAEAVNELFSELNSSNKKRMEEEMMKNKSGFDKVLKFAKEAM